MTAKPSPLHALHEEAQACFVEVAGLLLPAHYGTEESAPREYAAARDQVAVVDLTDRGVLEATGPQRQKFLQGMLSNDVAGRVAGQGCLASLLTAKGHVQALMRALVTKDSVLLEMPADRLAVVEQTLVHYRVAAPVRFRVWPGAVLGLLGPRAEGVLRATGANPPDLGLEDHATVEVAGQPVRLIRAGDLPGEGFVLHAEPAGTAALWTALLAAGARPLGRRALDALRIEAGRPWYGPDVTEENLLHETGLVPEYHSSQKGCYIGQEVIARLEARGGHVNKRIRGLRLSAPARPGQAVSVDGKDVGRVTTSATSPRLGPIALGYVHRSHFEPGTAVVVEGAPATVADLPL